MKFRVAAIQMTSTSDREVNLRAAEGLLAEAAASRAELAALPENFAFLQAEGEPAPDPEPCCGADPAGARGDVSPGQADGAVTAWLRAQARRHHMWILGGTIAERQAIGSPDGRTFNTSLLLDPEGRIAACYRKLHLFDVSIRGGPEFCESKTVAPGDRPVMAETPFGPVGLSVCYDLRFPELYRQMARLGARVLFVPAAFTAHTGKDHWEILLRARAIENLCYVVAPAQVGRHSAKRASHGHAMIIDPWGTVLAEAPDQQTVIVADLETDRIEEVRQGLPALGHVRKDLFPS